MTLFCFVAKQKLKGVSWIKSFIVDSVGNYKSIKIWFGAIESSTHWFELVRDLYINVFKYNFGFS